MLLPNVRSGLLIFAFSCIINKQNVSSKSIFNEDVSIAGETQDYGVRIFPGYKILSVFLKNLN